MIFLTSPGKTYSVNSVGGCTISAGGTTLATIPANVQTTFIAPDEEVTVSDNNAIIVEVTGVGAGGSGGSGEGGSGGVTAEEIKAVVPIAWSNYTTGTPSVNGTSFSYAIGVGASVFGAGSIGIGGYASAGANQSIVLGYAASASADKSVNIGGRFTDSSGNTLSNISQAPQTVVVGNGAQILNPTNDDGTPVIGTDGKQIVSSNSVTIGTGAVCKNLDSVVIGANAKAGNANSEGSPKTGVVIGANAEAIGGGANVAIGTSSRASGGDTSIGYMSRAGGGNSVTVGYNSRNNGAPKTVTIGSNATITNITNADNTVTLSERSTAIGYSATASAPDSIALGAGASTTGSSTVVIGAGSKLDTGSVAGTVIIGSGLKTTTQYTNSSVCIGNSISAEGNICVAVGSNAVVGAGGIAVGTSAKAKHYSIAIGYQCANTNNGVTAFRQQVSTGETYTQFYIMAAGSALATQYEEGEACMGYVVKNKTTGDLVAAGTQKLSVLFPNNSTFQPATLGLDDEYVAPKVFHPSDLDLPTEEPVESEDVEINIPEPEMEEYQPLPVYPIVEPEIPVEL